jgi:hypothetical protein
MTGSRGIALHRPPDEDTVRPVLGGEARVDAIPEDPYRRIAWAPTTRAASKPEFGDMIDDPPGRRWGY